MLKRTLILGLWFYTGWTFGALLSWAIGAPEIVGPVIGALATFFIAVHPRGLGLARGARNRELAKAGTALRGS